MIVLASLALIGIGTILLSKFSTLASIDTNAIPAERHGELKSRLMEDRFKRKLFGFSRAVADRLNPLGKLLRGFWLSMYNRLLELEQRYRRKATAEAPLTPGERSQREQRLEEILPAAQDALRRGEFETAETKAIAAIAVDHRNVGAYRILAAVYLQKKEYEQARETLRFIIDRLHVQDDDLFAELGEVSSGEGKFEEAKNALERSIQLNGMVAQHHHDLSRVELSLGNSLAAFEEARRAVELEPNNPKLLDSLVEISIVSGKRGWAQETFDKLRIVNPDNKKLAELQSRIDNMPKTKRR